MKVRKLMSTIATASLTAVCSLALIAPTANALPSRYPNIPTGRYVKVTNGKTPTPLAISARLPGTAKITKVHYRTDVKKYSVVL